MPGHTLSPSAAPDTQRVDVSPDFSFAMGRGPIEAATLPADCAAFVFDWGPVSTALRIFGPADLCQALADDAEGLYRISLFVSRAALLRLGGAEPTDTDRRGYHLPSELRAIAVAARDCAATGEARIVYRSGKAMELLCEVVRLRAEGALTPLPANNAISLADSHRVMAARRLIDERWNEKLTLDAIARACGLNRAKLTRSFRDMFDCTIAEALAERRLAQASRMLLTTDLQVSSIGYQAGYLNNASFARAFSRRFGVCPSDYRAARMAA